MRATLDVQEKHGIFSKSWTVDCRIEFSEAEHAAIEHGKLGREVVCTQGRDETKRYITLDDVIRAGGMRTTFPNLPSARKDQYFIEEQLLPAIKSLISTAERLGTGPRVIEL